MKVIWHDKHTFSLTQEGNCVFEDALRPDTKLFYLRGNYYDRFPRDPHKYRLKTIELDLGRPDPAKHRIMFIMPDFVEERYKFGFILKSLKTLEPTLYPQSLVLRNVHVDALVTNAKKQEIKTKIEEEVKAAQELAEGAKSSTASTSATTAVPKEGEEEDVFAVLASPEAQAKTKERQAQQEFAMLKTLEHFLAGLDKFGIQSLELHCQDRAHYDELNRQLRDCQLSGKLYVAACLDDANGVVTETTIWPTKKIGLQQWKPKYAAVSTSTSGDAKKKAAGRYREDTRARTGSTKAELEVAVNIEAQVQVTQEVQVQKDFTIEQQVEQQLQHQYQSNTNFQGPEEADRGAIGHFNAYRLDELLGIPASVTERALNEEAQTIGTHNAWDPNILTMAPRAKAAALYDGSRRYDDRQHTAEDRLNKATQINRATYVLIASIFEEYCSFLPANERLFDALRRRCKAGEQFDLMAEIQRLSNSNNQATAALGRQAYSYVARQYVRFMSGLTGAAPVHVDVLGDNDDITGISWQMLMHKYTLAMGINSWYIDESALLVACNNYQLFKGGVDYNNLPLGFRVNRCNVQSHEYKARPSEVGTFQEGWNYRGGGQGMDPRISIRTIAWGLDTYTRDKESNQNKLRIDPLAHLVHQDPFKQRSLVGHYRALNDYTPEGDDPALRKDPNRPAAVPRDGFISGNDPLDQHINYYRGVQDNPPAQPLADALYDKLPDQYKNDQIRAVIRDMCGRDRVNYNILSIVAVYGINALAGVASHLLAIREQHNDIYLTMLHCIGRNTSRSDWSYLATPEMLGKLEGLAKDLEKVGLEREKIKRTKGSDTSSPEGTDAAIPLNIRKLEVKLRFLEAVLNSSGNPTGELDARSAHTGNTDLETTIAAFEYFWTRFEAMTQSNDEQFTYRLQQTLVARTTGYIDGKRSIILDGLSGNAQTDLYRLYRILDHAAVKGPEMLQQQLVALNAEPEYEEARKKAGLPKSDGQDIAHPMKCSLEQHGAVYMMDVAKTFENDQSQHGNMFLHWTYDPIIITPEMRLLPGQDKGEYQADHRVAKPDIGSLAYYMRRLGYDNPTKADHEAILWRDLSARGLRSNDEKALTAAEIAWIREGYYQILAGFRPQYVEQILGFYFNYIITRKEYVRNYGDDHGHLAEGKIAIEGFLRSLQTLTERADCTVAKLTLILRNAEEQAATVDQLPEYQHRMQTARYSIEINDEHDLFYASAQFLRIGHANIVDRCLKVWFAGKRADSNIRPIFHGFEPHPVGATMNGGNYPNDPYWQSQSIEHNGNGFLDPRYSYQCEEFLPLCVLCDATIPKDPRYWKRDLAGVDVNMDRTSILTNVNTSKALQIMQFVNLWLDQVDWEQVQNFKQVPYQTLCAALKGKTTYDECKAAMNGLFPGLPRKVESLSDEVSWDELLETADPAVTINGQEYKTWKTSQSSSTELATKQDIIAFVSTAASKIDTWQATLAEKEYISNIVLRAYLLCFIRQQEIRHENGRREKLGDSAKAYVEDMLNNLIQGDAYNFLKKNAVQSIDQQIRAKLYTLVRLQSMNLQKHLQNLEIIRKSYDSDPKQQEGIEFLWQIVRGIKVKQPFKKKTRELSPDNLLRELAASGHIWATPYDESQKEQRHNHTLYKTDVQHFLHAIIKFATFAQEIKGYNFSHLMQAACNLYQLRDLRRYEDGQNSNSSSSSAKPAAVEHIPLQLFQVLEQVCRQQDKMLLVKYIAAFTVAKDADQQTKSNMAAKLECLMHLLKETPDLVMNLVFSVERRLGKNQHHPAPQLLLRLFDSVSQANPARQTQLIRILDQLLRNKFANPDHSPDAPTTKRLQADDIVLLEQFAGKIAQLNNKTLAALEKLVTPPICQSLEIKRDLLEQNALTEDYFKQKSTAFFRTAGGELRLGWNNNIAQDTPILQQKLQAIRIRDRIDQDWRPLDQATVTTLLNAWSRLITDVTGTIITLDDETFAARLQAAKQACINNPQKNINNAQWQADVTNLFAYIAVAEYRTSGNFPRPLQLISALYSKMNDGQNIFHRKKTGQGKTMAIALSDAFDALLGAKVIVSTSTYDLASRDALGRKKFHDYLGLKSANTPITPLTTTMEEFHKYDIHYGTLSDVTLWRLNQQAKGERFVDEKGNPLRIRLKADEMDRDAHSPVKQRLAKREASPKAAAAWEKLLRLIVEMVDTEKSGAQSEALLYAPYYAQLQQAFSAQANHNNILVFLERKIQALHDKIRDTGDPKAKIQLEDELELVVRAKQMLCTLEEAQPGHELDNAEKGKLDQEAIHSLVEAAVDSKNALKTWKEGVDYYDVPEYNWNDQGRNPATVAQYRKVSIVHGAFSKASRSIIYGRGMQQCLHLRANIEEESKPEKDRRYFVIDSLSDTVAMSTSQEELLGVSSIEDVVGLQGFGYETCEGYSATMGDSCEEQELIAHQKSILVQYPTHEEWQIKGLFEGLAVPTHQAASAIMKNDHALVVNSLDAQVETIIQIALQINQQTLGPSGRAQPLNLECATEQRVKELHQKLQKRINDDTTGKLKRLFPAIQTYTKGMVKELDASGQMFSYDNQNYNAARAALGRNKSSDKQKDLHEKVVKQMTQLGVITIGTIGTMARGTDAKPAPILDVNNSPLRDTTTNQPLTTNLTTIALDSEEITDSQNKQVAGRTHGRFKNGRAGFIFIDSEVANALNEHEKEVEDAQRQERRPNDINIPTAKLLSERNATRNRKSRDKSRLSDQVWRYLQYETFRVTGVVNQMAQEAMRGKKDEQVDYDKVVRRLSFVSRALHVKLSRYFQENPDAPEVAVTQYASAQWQALIDQAIKTLPQAQKDKITVNVQDGLLQHLAARRAAVQDRGENSSKQGGDFFRVITAPYYVLDLLSNTIFQSIAGLFTESEEKKKRAAIVGNRVFFMLFMSSSMLFVPSIVTNALEQAGIEGLTAKALSTPLSADVLGAFNYQTLLVYMGIGMVIGATFGGIVQASSQDERQSALREMEGAHTTMLSGIAAGATAGLAYAAQQYLLQYAAETLLTKYVSTTILSSPEITLAIMLTTHLLSGILSTIEYSFLNEAINKRMDISASYSGEHVSFIDR